MGRRSVQYSCNTSHPSPTATGSIQKTFENRGDLCSCPLDSAIEKSPHAKASRVIGENRPSSNQFQTECSASKRCFRHFGISDGIHLSNRVCGFPLPALSLLLDSGTQCRVQTGLVSLRQCSFVAEELASIQPERGRISRRNTTNMLLQSRP